MRLFGGLSKEVGKGCGFLANKVKIYFILQVSWKLMMICEVMLDIDGFMWVELGIGYILLYCGILR